MLGDFNSNLSNNDTHNILSSPFFNIPNGRQLYGVNKNKTCCSTKAPIGLRYSYDHVLSTFYNCKYRIINVSKASDHLPVILTIISRNKIGYDFDGVYHLDVGSVDQTGQRHPINFGPYRPFNKIINKVYNELIRGDEIYIITARNPSQTSKNVIMNLLSNTKLKPYIDMISIYYTSNYSKVDVIKDKKINEFYDDSCLRINELYQAIANAILPNLKELYLVEPDQKSWIQINKNNIKPLCKYNFTNESLFYR